MVSLHFRSEVHLRSHFRRGSRARVLRIEGDLLCGARPGGAVRPLETAPRTLETPGARAAALGTPAGGAADGRRVAGVHCAGASPPAVHGASRVNRTVLFFFFSLSPSENELSGPQRLHEITQYLLSPLRRVSSDLSWGHQVI